MTGTTLDTYEYIPRSVLECVALQLKVRAPMLATLRALSRRVMTRHRHQNWACRYLGISRMTVADEETLSSALIAEMSVTVDRAQLVTRAHEMFWARRWRIPAHRSIERRVLEAVRRVEAADMEALIRVLRPEEMQQLHKQLVEGRANGASVLEWIRRPASNRGRKSRALVVSKLEFLRSTFSPIASCAIPIPPERLRAYARRLHRRRLDHAKDLAEPGRTLEVVGFIHTTLAQQADRAVRMLLMAVARTWGQAHDRVRSRVSAAPSSHTALIEELCRKAQNDALSDAAYRDYARERLTSWVTLKRSTKESRAAGVRAVLVEKAHRVRALIKQVIAMRLDGPAGDPVLAALGNLKDTYELGSTELFEGATLDFNKIWQPLVADPDRARALRAYEAATLWAVRCGLRSGRLFLPYSWEYRGKERLLMPADAWAAAQDAFRERHQLPADPEPFLDRSVAQVEAGLEALDEAVGQGTVWVAANGFHLKLGEDPRVTVESDVIEALRERIANRTKERVDKVQLPD
jgi:hypothetical protein